METVAGPRTTAAAAALNQQELSTDRLLDDRRCLSWTTNRPTNRPTDDGVCCALGKRTFAEATSVEVEANQLFLLLRRGGGAAHEAASSANQLSNVLRLKIELLRIDVTTDKVVLELSDQYLPGLIEDLATLICGNAARPSALSPFMNS